MLRYLFRRLVKALKWFVIGSIALVLLLRFIPPPGTALMVERKIESWIDNDPIDLQRTWTPWDEISDNLKVAVIASEDQKFPEHWGSTSTPSRRPWPITSVAARSAAPAP